MLYVFVDKSQTVAFFAAYAEKEAKKYLEFKHFQFCARYFVATTDKRHCFLFRRKAARRFRRTIRFIRRGDT